MLLFELTHLARLQVQPGQNVSFVGALVKKKNEKKSPLSTGRDHTDGRHIYVIVYVPKEKKREKKERIGTVRCLGSRRGFFFLSVSLH